MFVILASSNIHHHNIPSTHQLNISRFQHTNTSSIQIRESSFGVKNLQVKAHPMVDIEYGDRRVLPVEYRTFDEIIISTNTNRI
jgi:hypothetical protein